MPWAKLPKQVSAKREHQDDDRHTQRITRFGGSYGGTTRMELLASLWTTVEWNIALTIGLFVLGGIMSVIAWLFKKRMEAYDKHLDECRERAITTARMDERLHVVEEHVKGIRINIHWLGNCIIILGTKLDVELPNRPQ